MASAEILTRNGEETKKLGKILAREVLKEKKTKRATVISLEGELGSGKTTFTQGFAKGLGIKENPRSPTFVIMRIYSVRRKAYGVRQFIHIDAYRLKSKGFKVLNWRDFIRDPKNIILVEWGDKIKNILPKNAMRIIFKHIRHHEHRDR